MSFELVPPINRRILLIDDTPAIHEDFRKILVPAAETGLEAMEAALFGDAAGDAANGPIAFELDSAYQGAEGLAKVRDALAAGRPYAMAFVDVRMPPGWDGIETIERLWQADPQLQVVICTAYSDYSWPQVIDRLKLLLDDRLLILKKPFDIIEVSQLAATLTAKWQITRQAEAKMADLEAAVAARTRDLTATNAALQAEIEERKALQSQLLQSEKLASIGQLAAGVAHEMNNPLGFVQSNLATLRDYVDGLLEIIAVYDDQALVRPDLASHVEPLRAQMELDLIKADLPDLLRETRDGVSRVRRIVQDLKDFSRVEVNPDWQWADLHRGIDSTLNILSNEIKYRADVVKEYGELPEVQCVPSQINQVVMNLVINAAQAMGGERGTITLRTGCADGKAWIEVADNGCGIPAENLGSIFDPFFTTKPIGQGTGLGLSVSYGIVQKHGGNIEVQSEPGRGTTFRVTLPIAQPTATEQ